MDHSVPIYTAYGVATPHLLRLSLLGTGGDVSFSIDEGFAGKPIEEEISLESLCELAGDGPALNQDILGLRLEGEEDKVLGWIGLGSGNERFVLLKTDLVPAVEGLAKELAAGA